MAQTRTPVKNPSGARTPLPEVMTPAVRRLVDEARGLGHRIAAGERGPTIETAVEEWHQAWQAATGQNTGGGRVRT